MVSADCATPAIATLYFALAEIWAFPLASEIVGTTTAVDAFMGVLLGVSAAKYKQAIEVKE